MLRSQIRMPPGCLHPPSGHCLGHQAGCCKSCQSEDHREKETRTAPDRLHKELSGGRGVSATVRSRAARRLFTAVFARKHLDQDRLSTLSRAAFRKLDRLRTVYEFEKLVVGHDIAVAGLDVTQGLPVLTVSQRHFILPERNCALSVERYGCTLSASTMTL
jgi:hypothetical protein